MSKNTALALAFFGFSMSLSQIAMAETITKSYFQGKGQPTPAIIPALIDNNATYIKSSDDAKQSTRYLYVGPLQKCPSVGVTGCMVSFSETITKQVARGTNIDVNLTGPLTEKLTSAVKLGFSYTVTDSRAMTWSTGATLLPGFNSRPVSYVIRVRGNGDVKNAFIHTGRTKVASACRPSGGCFRITDTYVRMPNTKVGGWLADLPVNSSPTTTYKTFRGEIDPNQPYKMD
jgi:hypothetical protein